MKLSLVIPTINSSDIIVKNIKILDKIISEIKEIEDYEIIVAAQKSVDNTFQILREIKSEKIIPIFITQIGKGAGLNAGIRKAKFEWVLLTDDDLPYPFESMRKLFENTKNYDIIIASRYLEKIKHKIPLIRKIASKSYLILANSLLKIPQKDVQAGMKLIKKEVFEKIGYPKEIGYVWDTEMLHLANKYNCNIIEVPVECNHKHNKLVIYKAAPAMFFGVIKVWKRSVINGKRI